MFFGEYEYKVDEKGRIPIPPKFRREFREGVILNPGMEKCITVYAMPEFQKVATTMRAQTVSPSKLRKLKRAVFGATFQLLLDGQGRFILPAILREYAAIGDIVTVVGTDDYLELWDKELWASEKIAAWEDAWQITESLEIR